MATGFGTRYNLYFMLLDLSGMPANTKVAHSMHRQSVVDAQMVEGLYELKQWYQNLADVLMANLILGVPLTLFWWEILPGTCEIDRILYGNKFK